MSLLFSHSPLYTVPAWKETQEFFLEYGCYFFEDTATSSFAKQQYERAEYIGLGEEFTLEENKKEYIELAYIGKISTIGSFTTTYDEEYIISLTPSKEYGISQTELTEAFKKQIAIFHRFNNGKINDTTKKNWIFIYVEPKNIVKIQEDRLYPTKSLISFDIRLDTNNEYIPSKHLLKTLRVNETTFLNREKNILLVNGGEIQIGNNNKTYGKIIELLTHSENGVCSLDDVGVSANYGDIWNLEKNFNKALFCKYLDFTINVLVNGSIKKVEKMKK